MTIELRVVTGARAGTRERFDGPVVKVGRHPLSDMRFDAYADLDVSTRHAELHNTNGTWTIRDQQSTNGTFVNGEVVEGERRLNDGDVISFGSTGPRVEVHLSGARAVPRTLATSARPRRNTSDRIAAAVHAHTMSLRRGLLAALVLLAAIGGALVWWQRKAAARERELLSLIARSESASEGLARAIAQMRPRDSAFAAELARQYAATKRSVADGRQLATGGAAATDGSIALFSERLQRAARLQSSIMQIDFARVHDLNDPAVAMIASDLDGTFVAGTAFGVTPAGLLVTNRHVTRTESGTPARRVRVLFANTRDWLPAHVVRASERDDLALLQVDVPGTYPVVAGVSRTGALARVGAAVASIGFPHAIDTPMEGTGLHVTARTTTTAGTVSKRLDRVIQIDSYAGKGSSGSPLFDARGEVVGVIYGGAAESAGRIVYAVPAERVAEFLGEEGRAIVP